MLSYPPLAPAFAVRDGVKAIAFYKAAFGAEERYRLIDPESGKIGHAELTIHGALFMLSDEYPEFNKAPDTLGGVSAKFLLMSNDVDAALARAEKAGATIIHPLTDQFYGHRDVRIRDPFGHEWLLAQEIEKVTPVEMQRRWDAMSAPSKADSTNLPATTLRITRLIHAPRARVYAAWTDMDLTEQWWGPEGCRTDSLVADVREGGVYHWNLTTPDDAPMSAQGEYREIRPGKKIVFTWHWDDDPYWEDVISVITVEFFEKDATTTELRLTHEDLPSEESRDNHIGGWNSALDKLELLLRDAK